MTRSWIHIDGCRHHPQPRARKKAATGDLAAVFWSAAIPFALLFWALIAYAIHSLF
jgi:hypothetical protein